MSKINLVYIGPLGYSGSTLLDRALGSHNKVVTTGELKSFDEWNEKNLLCGCGKPFNECEFWNGARSRLSPKFKLKGRVESKKINFLYQKPSNFKEMAKSFGQRSQELYQALIDETNANIVVDSSKIIGRLALLAESDLFDIKVLHLIRDGREVCGSMKTTKKRPSRGEGMYTKPKSVLNSALKYYYANKSLEKVTQEYNLPVQKVFFQDLVGKKQETLNGIFNFLGLDDLNVSELSSVHTISGSHYKWVDEGKTIKDKALSNYQLNLLEQLTFGLICGNMNKRNGYK